MLVVTAFNSQQ